MNYLRGVLLPGLAFVVALAAFSALVVEPLAGWSGLVGGLATVLLLTSTPIVLGPVAAQTPAVSLPVALIFYFTKVTLLAAVFVTVNRSGVSGWIDVRSLGVAVFATTLAWIVLLVVAQVRDRHPIYDLP